jgi:transposase-like protein
VIQHASVRSRELRSRRSKPTARLHLDEMVLSDRGSELLWRAVDDEGEVLDLLVQRRRDKTAAVKLSRKLLKKPGFAPEILVTDRLRSYAAAKVELGLFGRHLAATGIAQEQSRRLFSPSRQGGEREGCSASSRLDQPNGSCPFTRQCKTHSTPNGI